MKDPYISSLRRSLERAHHDAARARASRDKWKARAQEAQVERARSEAESELNPVVAIPTRAWQEVAESLEIERNSDRDKLAAAEKRIAELESDLNKTEDRGVWPYFENETLRAVAFELRRLATGAVRVKAETRDHAKRILGLIEKPTLGGVGGGGFDPGDVVVVAKTISNTSVAPAAAQKNEAP